MGMLLLRFYSLFLLCFVAACNDGSKPIDQPPGTVQPAPLPAGASNDWFSQRTMYHIVVRSFFDSDGNGLGDLAGLKQKLPYLVDLRVGSLLLDAIQPTSFRDGNRALSDFTSIAPELGDFNDFNDLLVAARAADLKVILTVPLNQTDSFHPWFMAALANTTSEKGQWYVFSAAATTCDDIPPAEPDIYGSLRWSEAASGSVYYHRFAASSPDLNLAHPPVVAAIKQVLTFWLDKGVDGIFIPDAYAFIEDGADCENTSASRELLQELRQVFDNYPGTVLLATDRYSSPLLNNNAERVASYAANQAANLVLDAEPAIYLHAVGDDSFPASDFVDYVDDLQKRLTAAGGGALLPSSHQDRPRAAASLGNNLQLYRLFLALYFSLPATPLLLYGDELGLGAAGTYAVDVRDLGTPPMPWTVTGPAYGFSQGQPWLEAAVGAELRNVQISINDEGSLYTFARKLIDLRNYYPALRSPDFVPLTVADQHTGSPLTDVLAWRRGAGTAAVIVVHNPTQQVRDLLVDASGSAWVAGQRLVDLLRPDQPEVLYAGDTSPTLRMTLDPRSSRYLAAVSDVNSQ